MSHCLSYSTHHIAQCAARRVCLALLDAWLSWKPLWLTSGPSALLQAANEGSRLVLAPFKLDMGPPAAAKACMQVLAHSHIMLAAVLPTVVTFLWDAQSRAAFQAAQRRRRAQASFGLPEAALMSTLLVSLTALVVWEALQLLV